MNARYRLVLERALVRIAFTAYPPYVMNVGTSLYRIACGDLDYTPLLARTERALQDLTGYSLDWQVTAIASEHCASLTSSAPLRGDPFTTIAIALLRDELPRWYTTRYRSYGTERTQPRRDTPPRCKRVTPIGA
jgi:hypothetical protein